MGQGHKLGLALLRLWLVLLVNSNPKVRLFQNSTRFSHRFCTNLTSSQGSRWGPSPAPVPFVAKLIHCTNRSVRISDFSGSHTCYVNPVTNTGAGPANDPFPTDERTQKWEQRPPRTKIVKRKYWEIEINSHLPMERPPLPSTTPWKLNASMHTRAFR